MSCIKKVESFQQVIVNIEFDKDCFRSIEETAKFLLKQKFDKMNILLKDLDVYHNNNMLIVNDRYNACKELQDIAGSFGFTIQPIDCNLKGKSYIISDEIIKILVSIGSSFDLRQYETNVLSAEIKKLISETTTGLQEDENLADMIKKVRDTGIISTAGIQKVISTYEDLRLKQEERGEIMSDAGEIKKRILSFVINAKSILEKGNEQLRNGTAKLLYYRARQMGYIVKEEREGAKIQLVLVRAE